jgi:hypothetical protein
MNYWLKGFAVLSFTKLGELNIFVIEMIVGKFGLLSGEKRDYLE